MGEELPGEPLGGWPFRNEQTRKLWGEGQSLRLCRWDMRVLSSKTAWLGFMFLISPPQNCVFDLPSPENKSAASPLLRACMMSAPASDGVDAPVGTTSVSAVFQPLSVPQSGILTVLFQIWAR